MVPAKLGSDADGAQEAVAALPALMAAPSVATMGPTVICRDSRTPRTFTVIDQVRDGGNGRIDGFSLTARPNGREPNSDGGCWPASYR